VARTELENTLVLAQVEARMDAKLGTKEEHELERLSILIEEYESKHYPIAHLVSL
jgi:hypothetical protein